MSYLLVGENSSDICIVRELKTQYNNDGSVRLTEFDCPVLFLTNDLYVVSSNCFICPISVAHICSSLCTFSVDFLTYIHDFSNCFAITFFVLIIII